MKPVFATAALLSCLISTWNLPNFMASAAQQLQNPSSDTEAIRKKAEAGDAQAQFEIGEKYRLGTGVPQDYREMARWWRKSAEQGYARAQRYIGLLFFGGQVVSKDYDEAARWFRKAAEQGDATAQHRLGYLYSQGWGVPQDYAEAARWSRKSADQGNALGQENLGWAYRDGKGVAQDYAEAAKWYRKSADQGNASAQSGLGVLYYNGFGVVRDYAEAARWWRKSADQGNALAQSNLGKLYLHGQGVAQDYAEAAKWIRKSADQGNANGQSDLGLLYNNGQGVLQDYAEAAKWYRKSADQGNATAQSNLGLLYYNGQGVLQDYVEAYRWFNRAAAQGDPLAKEQREGVASRMTREQIAKAQQPPQVVVPPKPGGTPPTDASPKGSGTGFFVTADGYLVTSYHVVEGASRSRVVSPAGTKDARIIRFDDANDIALLKIDGDFAALAIQTSRNVRMGDSVATVGFPNPGLQGFAPKFSKGEISALTGVQDDPKVFQISVPVQPGNSGGALADSSGNVIGIIKAKLGLKAAIASSGTIPENVNYALKSSYLLSFLESVPGLTNRLKTPATTPQQMNQVAAELEKATVLVLVY